MRCKRGMNSNMLRSAPFMLCFLISSCATNQNLVFTKPNVSNEQTRIDWGLCGGNYQEDGLPDIRAADLSNMYECMNSKGYRTHNEVRTEREDWFSRTHPEVRVERVDWISPRKYNPLIPNHVEP